MDSPPQDWLLKRQTRETDQISATTTTTNVIVHLNIFRWWYSNIGGAEIQFFAKIYRIIHNTYVASSVFVQYNKYTIRLGGPRIQHVELLEVERCPGSSKRGALQKN